MLSILSGKYICLISRAVGNYTQPQKQTADGAEKSLVNVGSRVVENPRVESWGSQEGREEGGTNSPSYKGRGRKGDPERRTSCPRKSSVVLRTMRNAELADRIPSPIKMMWLTHGTVSSPSERAAVWGGMYAWLTDAARFSQAEIFFAFHRILGAI